MRRPPEFPPGSMEKLKPALKAARTPAQLERVLCLWLRASLRLNSDQIATAIGWTPGAVRRFQALYLNEGDAVLEAPGRGGRRRGYLSRAAEESLLRSLEPPPGTVLELKAIHVAYQRAIGRSVPKSTVYRMFRRHGWRTAGAGLIKPPKKAGA